jgi:hypothetical protein
MKSSSLDVYNFKKACHSNNRDRQKNQANKYMHIIPTLCFLNVEAFLGLCSMVDVEVELLFSFS